MTKKEIPPRRRRRSDTGTKREVYAGQPLDAATRREGHELWISNRNWEYLQEQARAGSTEETKQSVSDVINTLLDVQREFRFRDDAQRV